MQHVIRVAVFALVVAGCALVHPPAPVGPLVTVEATGGMCRTGTCRSVIAIEADGRVHQVEPDPVEISQVTGESVDVLQTAIAITDFAAIRSRPFLGTCPTAYDGQELVYTIATANDLERIASCDVEIDPDMPLFTAIHAILGASMPAPIAP
jgi:hypothetical protein